MRCGDCWATEYVPSRRHDVCVDCFARRLATIEAVKDGRLSMQEFQRIQKALGHQRGTGKRLIEKLLRSAAVQGGEDGSTD